MKRKWKGLLLAFFMAVLPGAGCAKDTSEKEPDTDKEEVSSEEVYLSDGGCVYAS